MLRSSYSDSDFTGLLRIHFNLCGLSKNFSVRNNKVENNGWNETVLWFTALICFRVIAPDTALQHFQVLFCFDIFHLVKICEDNDAPLFCKAIRM